MLFNIKYKYLYFRKKKKQLNYNLFFFKKKMLHRPSPWNIIFFSKLFFRKKNIFQRKSFQKILNTNSSSRMIFLKSLIFLNKPYFKQRWMFLNFLETKDNLYKTSVLPMKFFTNIYYFYYMLGTRYGNYILDIRKKLWLFLFLKNLLLNLLLKKTKIVFVLDSSLIYNKVFFSFLKENDFCLIQNYTPFIEIIDLSKISYINGFLTNPTAVKNTENKIIENDKFFFFLTVKKTGLNLLQEVISKKIPLAALIDANISSTILKKIQYFFFISSYTIQLCYYFISLIFSHIITYKVLEFNSQHRKVVKKFKKILKRKKLLKKFSLTQPLNAKDKLAFYKKSNKILKWKVSNSLFFSQKKFHYNLFSLYQLCSYLPEIFRLIRLQKKVKKKKIMLFYISKIVSFYWVAWYFQKYLLYGRKNRQALYVIMHSYTTMYKHKKKGKNCFKLFVEYFTKQHLYLRKRRRYYYGQFFHKTHYIYMFEKILLYYIFKKFPKKFFFILKTSWRKFNKITFGWKFAKIVSTLSKFPAIGNFYTLMGSMPLRFDQRLDKLILEEKREKAKIKNEKLMLQYKKNLKPQKDKKVQKTPKLDLSIFFNKETNNKLQTKPIITNKLNLDKKTYATKKKKK
jgi:hypothetical protein